jgi:hypothetical protein
MTFIALPLIGAGELVAENQRSGVNTHTYEYNVNDVIRTI